MSPVTTAWAVSTEGVDHDPRGARGSAYLSTGPLNGIRPSPIGTGLVRATATPSNQVGVMPFGGALVVPGRFESYHVSSPSEVLVPIRATGSGGGRSDVVIWRIDDPGGTLATIDAHEFSKPFVVENVSASITTIGQLRAAKNIDYPALWLARVTLPASTATVTNAMIDASGRVQIGGQRHTETRDRAGDIGPKALNNRGGEAFPSIGGQHSFYIPEWATRMRVRAEWRSILYHHGVNTYGSAWVRIGGEALRTKSIPFDAPTTTGGSGSVVTDSWVLVDDLAIPANMRGTTQSFHLWAMLGSNAPTGTITIRAQSQTMIETEFREAL